MAAMLKWIFEGGENGNEVAAKRGEQRAYPNDPVTDELLGDGKVIGYGAKAGWLKTALTRRRRCPQAPRARWNEAWDEREAGMDEGWDQEREIERERERERDRDRERERM